MIPYDPRFDPNEPDAYVLIATEAISYELLWLVMLSLTRLCGSKDFYGVVCQDAWWACDEFGLISDFSANRHWSGGRIEGDDWSILLINADDPVAYVPPFVKEAYLDLEGLYIFQAVNTGRGN